MTQPQIVNLCHNATAKPALLILYLFMLVSFSFVSFIIVKKDRARVLLILLLSSLISGVMLGLLYFLPLTITQPFFNFFS